MCRPNPAPLPSAPQHFQEVGSAPQYLPVVQSVFPKTTIGGVKLALDLQRQKLAATYVDAATCKKGINCAWSEKFLTWVQLIDVRVQKYWLKPPMAMTPILRSFLEARCKRMPMAQQKR